MSVDSAAKVVEASSALRRALLWKRPPKAFRTVRFEGSPSKTDYYCVFSRTPFCSMYACRNTDSFAVLRDSVLSGRTALDLNYRLDGFFLCFELEPRFGRLGELKGRGIRFSGRKPFPCIYENRPRMLPRGLDEAGAVDFVWLCSIASGASKFIEAGGKPSESGKGVIPSFSMSGDGRIECRGAEFRPANDYNVFSMENPAAVLDFVNAMECSKGGALEAAVLVSPFVSGGGGEPAHGSLFFLASLGDAGKYDLLDSDEIPPGAEPVAIVDALLEHVRKTARIPRRIYAANLETAAFISSVCDVLGIDLAIGHSMVLEGIYDKCCSKAAMSN